MNSPSCRFCGSALGRPFLDLGMSPPCESFLPLEHLNRMEPFYPLQVYVCGTCFLVQLEEYMSPENIFREYAYFSSYADSWLQHARNYADEAVGRFGLGAGSFVVEVASNDGYLLQYFLRKGIPVLGIEPAVNVAQTALQKGVPTLTQFFGETLAREMAAAGRQPDLLIGNNVLAQVPDLNGFVEGMKILLKPRGVITMEFPHVLRLMEGNQFDTIYHEHFSYFSLMTVEKIFARHGLRIFDVEELSTHGGSLRIYACHGEGDHSSAPRLADLRGREQAAGLANRDTYFSFQDKVIKTKGKLLNLLIQARQQGRSIVGYGAPGKGNTLLNYCGIRTDFLDYVVDRNPYKHGKFTPGTHIPIYNVDKIKETRPDYVLILPWNFKDEIMRQMSYIRDWGGKFIVPIPEAKIWP